MKRTVAFILFILMLLCMGFTFVVFVEEIVAISIGEKRTYFFNFPVNPSNALLTMILFVAAAFGVGNYLQLLLNKLK